jgi:hypothetical protein
VLSRPEVRLRYDTLRSKYLGVTGPYGSLNRSSGASTGYEPFVPVGFTTQRDNFGRVQREAGATAQDTRERMRVERFRNLPLSEKKVIPQIDYVLTLAQTKILVLFVQLHRARPVTSLATSLLFAVPVAAFLAYGAYKWSKEDSRVHR